MAKQSDTLEAIRKALRSEARVDLEHHPIRLTLSAGDLVIEGEVADIAAKKLALERAAAVADVRGIVDRLRVAPAERMEDGAVRDLVRDALLEEPALRPCSIRVRVKDRWEPIRILDGAAGAIDVSVEKGVVLLDGSVPGLGLKRLAGVLAWWVPGAAMSSTDLALRLRNRRARPGLPIRCGRCWRRIRSSARKVSW